MRNVKQPFVDNKEHLLAYFPDLCVKKYAVYNGSESKLYVDLISKDQLTFSESGVATGTIEGYDMITSRCLIVPAGSGIEVTLNTAKYNGDFTQSAIVMCGSVNPTTDAEDVRVVAVEW